MYFWLKQLVNKCVLYRCLKLASRIISLTLDHFYRAMTDTMKYILSCHAMKEKKSEVSAITIDLLKSYWNQVTISFPLFRHVLCEKKDLEIHKRLTHTTTEACHFLCIKRHHNIALFIFGHNIPNRMLGNIPPQSFGWTLMNWGSTWGLRASTMCHIFPSIHLLDFFVFVTPQWSCGSFCDTLWVIIMVHRPNLID